MGKIGHVKLAHQDPASGGLAMSCVPAWGGEILPQGVLELLGRNKWKDDEETNALPKASYSSPHTSPSPARLQIVLFCSGE